MKDDKGFKKTSASETLDSDIIDNIDASNSELLELLKEQKKLNDEVDKMFEELDQMNPNDFDIFNDDTCDSNIDFTNISKNIIDENKENKVKLSVADILTNEFPSVKALEFMAKELDKHSNGRITMNLFSDGAFGTETEALLQTREGTLDMARVNIIQFNNTCPETIIPALPYVFDSISHMHKAIDSEAGKIILDSISQTDYIALALYDSGARNVYAHKPIQKMSDMQGLNIRILPSLHYKKMIEYLGAKTNSIPLDEVEAELHSGALDAAENNIFSYQGLEHYRQCKFYSLTEHIIAPDVLVFSKKSWLKLTEEDQKIITEAAYASALASRKFCQEAEAASIQKAELEGAVIVKDVDKLSFKNSSQNIYSQIAITSEQKYLLRKIQDIK
mgnify:CR=1 FL=1